MEWGNILAFVVFPYITLTMFTLGHGGRYLIDRYQWNARSSEFLEKERLKWGVTLFHWGILLALFGHVSGLLIPQWLLDRLGIDSATHLLVAHYSGLVVGVATLVGLALLLRRRLSCRRIERTTRTNDLITLSGLLLVSATGLYNVLFGHFSMLETIAPWIRSILLFAPQPELMQQVPLGYKIHVISGLALLAYSPFSRLVHIWSAPLSYLFRSWILYRRRIAA